MNEWDSLKISTPLRNAISDLGYATPTPIQKEVFSVTLSGQDVCAIASTGTGKTLAYLLPSLMHWKFNKLREPQVLILVPTRELVAQVVEEFKAMAVYTNATIVGVYGGVGMNRHKAELAEGADFIVGTPGRVYDLIMVQALKTRSMKKVVVDEFDVMLDLGFRTQIKNIFELIPSKRQNLLFSATMQTEVADFMDEFFDNVAKIEVDKVGTTIDAINQIVYEVPNVNTKINVLAHYLHKEEARRVIVFVDNKKLANRVFEMLEELFPTNIALIHSNKEQTYRFRSIEGFANGQYRVLVATDILSRGIDIADVSHVINFNVPDIVENYIHRIGRTGRAKKGGTAVTLVSDKEKQQWENVSSFINKQIPFSPIPNEVEVSTELLNWEIEPTFSRELNASFDRPTVFNAFHEKKDKNKKVNVKVSRKDKMQAKYGKPISRGKKR